MIAVEYCLGLSFLVGTASSVTYLALANALGSGAVGLENSVGISQIISNSAASLGLPAAAVADLLAGASLVISDDNLSVSDVITSGTVGTEFLIYLAQINIVAQELVTQELYTAGALLHKSA